MSTKKIYDVVIIGGGISGLSAAITAATEGFTTVVVDGAAHFGGQAGSASLIENVIGFPEGVSGKELTEKSLAQAEKFGVELVSGFRVMQISKQNGVFNILSQNSDQITAKSVVVALGLEYKNLDTANVNEYMGIGVSYGSPSLTEDSTGKTVTIVGGANSAGQAAVFLAQCSNCKVNLVVRAESIERGMSDYLVKKVKSYANISIYTNAEVVEGEGIECIECFKIETPEGIVRLPCERAFVLIGAQPNTRWLQDSKLGIDFDDNGFIYTDKNLMATPGVFAIGDIRTDSIKRVASAIGEGARAVNSVRTHLIALSMYSEV